MAHRIPDHGYADDKQLYKLFRSSFDGREQNIVFKSLSVCIQKFKQWAATNKLEFNDFKADAVLVSSNYCKTRPTPSALQVGAKLISPSCSVQNLGVVVDSQLTVDLQIKQSCKKAFYHLSRIARLKKQTLNLPPTTNWCIPLWYPSSTTVTHSWQGSRLVALIVYNASKTALLV